MANREYPPAVISALIRVTGWSQASIADALGVSKASVSYSVQTGANPVITVFISQLLGIPATDLWPYRRRTSCRQVSSLPMHPSSNQADR